MIHYLTKRTNTATAAAGAAPGASGRPRPQLGEPGEAPGPGGATTFPGEPTMLPRVPRAGRPRLRSSRGRKGHGSFVKRLQQRPAGDTVSHPPEHFNQQKKVTPCKPSPELSAANTGKTQHQLPTRKPNEGSQRGGDGSDPPPPAPQQKPPRGRTAVTARPPTPRSAPARASHPGPVPPALTRGHRARPNPIRLRYNLLSGSNTRRCCPPRPAPARPPARSAGQTRSGTAPGAERAPAGQRRGGGA